MTKTAQNEPVGGEEHVIGGGRNGVQRKGIVCGRGEGRGVRRCSWWSNTVTQTWRRWTKNCRGDRWRREKSKKNMDCEVLTGRARTGPVLKNVWGPPGLSGLRTDFFLFIFYFLNSSCRIFSKLFSLFGCRTILSINKYIKQALNFFLS